MSGARLRITHIVDSIAEEASGPSYSVPSLCAGLAARECDVRLLTIGPDLVEMRAGFEHRRCAQDFARAPLLGKLRLSRTLRGEIAKRADVLHTHGVWLMANIYPAWEAKRTGAPFLISPRGMLSEAAMQFSGLRKKAMWEFMQRSAARQATCFHATSDDEAQDIRKLGLLQPVAVIPNGVDVPEAAPRIATARRKLLYLGRLHAKKGLDRLLKSWSTLEATFPDWDLEIIGPSEHGHVDELKSLARTLGLSRVAFPGPLYADEKRAGYRSAELFVMPTLNENFGMTVAEALAVSVPVVCTKGAPWSGLSEHQCGWWVDGDVEAIAEALRDGMSRPRETLSAMGERGRAWMLRDFSWAAVAQDMIDVYRWQLGSGDRPASIRI
ncbi:MAG: glycosyltransferase [Beijerinckiaceae bacterium]|nr:glycosyltransferase [Beijerinckiaceae bacterium]